MFENLAFRANVGGFLAEETNFIAISRIIKTNTDTSLED